jgi:hypothetical protein
MNTKADLVKLRVIERRKETYDVHRPNVIPFGGPRLALSADVLYLASLKTAFANV